MIYYNLCKHTEDFDDYMFHTYDINRQYNLSLTNEEAQTIKATSVSNVSELLPDELYLTYIIYDEVSV